MKTSKTHRELSLHRVPCGAVSINASAVCKRRLRDTFDRLLDKLCEDCHKWQEPELPKGYELTEDGSVMSSDHLRKQAKTVEKIKKTKEKNKLAAAKEAEKPTRSQLKEEMLEKEKLKAEVKLEAEKYKEKLTGNSKLGQDISGKIKKR